MTLVVLLMKAIPLDKLASVMPKVDPEMVQRRLYGSKHL
jgi:hypothetical protein